MQEQDRLAMGADFRLAVAQHAGALRLQSVAGGANIFHFIADMMDAARSEEHTSELQSHRDLHSFPTRRSSDLDFRLAVAQHAGALRLQSVAGGANIFHFIADMMDAA